MSADIGNKVDSVPFVDIQRNLAPVAEQLRKKACDMLDSCRFIGGAEVKGFEKEMAEWLGVPEFCGVACATSGLSTSLRALGVGPGDEVITTVHTAIPTAEAITLCGARVVFCDIEGDGRYNLDPGKIEELITPRTKAIIAVHLYGTPCDLDKILTIAEKHNIFVIEDCAQAQGARYGDEYVGKLGDVGVFSFFPSKNLGGFGDGGGVIARDPSLMKKIRMLSNHGRARKYHHEYEGTNSRLDTIQAGLLRLCLPCLSGWNESRRLAARWYMEDLSGIDDVLLPAEIDDRESVYHVFVIVVPDRDALAEYLHKHGVETGVHYPYSLNMQKAYAYLGQGAGSFPKAEYACEHMLSLPMFPTIRREEISRVGELVRQFFNGKRGLMPCIFKKSRNIILISRS